MVLERALKSNIQEMIEELDKFNSDPKDGTTRILFTEPELKARNYIKEEMAKVGLVIKEDAIGNIFATLEGSDPSLPVVWTGSHIDTVINAGKFDGMAGVVAGIEAARLIKESGQKHKRNIEVLVYTSEEPTRFGLGCLGSRAMAGELSLDKAQELRDNQGNSLTEVLESLGYNLAEFDQVPVKQGDVFAAVELHIEQGAVLESLEVPIGIVESIAGPSSFEVSVAGKQSHAGGTPMSLRHDAFLACCEIAMEAEKLAKESASKDTVATVGRVEVLPNASNVISGEVNFSIDIRDSDYEVKSECIANLMEFIEKVEKKRGLTIRVDKINDDQPTPSDQNIIKILEESCADKGIPFHKMISGAFHDSMMVGKFAPIAMIFVPSKDGISHSPKEWTDYSDIARGTDLLADTLLKLANQ